MASRYITFPFVTDARDLMARAFDYLKAKVPGWNPAEGNLDVWMIEAFGDQAADVATLASQVPKAIFRYYGSKLFDLRPIDAVAAQTTSTWFFNDSVGHVIRAGAQVGIRDSAGNLIPFQVLVEVDVAGGLTQTTTGAVVLMAVEAGAHATSLGGVGSAVELIDSLAWVDHITMVAATSGGVDAESDDDYLNRLSLELETMSPRPILPADFSILARNVAGVQRAVTLDGYNPAGGGTFGNERMVTVIGVDALGQPISSPVKTAVAAYLDSLRETNFVINTMDAVMREIDVTIHVKVVPGYGTIDVADRIKAAVMAFLNPAIWGIDAVDNPNTPKTWNNTTVVRYLELAAVVNNVSGVDYITTLTIGLHGGAQVAADYTMTGVVPLPFTSSADITVVATL